MIGNAIYYIIAVMAVLLSLLFLLARSIAQYKMDLPPCSSGQNHVTSNYSQPLKAFKNGTPTFLDFSLMTNPFVKCRLISSADSMLPKFIPLFLLSLFPKPSHVTVSTAHFFLWSVKGMSLKSWHLLLSHLTTMESAILPNENTTGLVNIMGVVNKIWIPRFSK